jgi:hypothetical protein
MTSVRADEHFAIVPEFVLYADISANAVRLYAVLRRHADREGTAFPSRSRMAEQMHISVDTLDRAMRELVGLGAVEIEKRRVEGTKEADTNLYRLRSLRPGSRTDAATGSRTDAEGVAARMRQEVEPSNESYWNEREPAEAAADQAASGITVHLGSGPPTKPSKALTRGRDLIFEGLYEIWVGQPYPGRADAGLTPRNRDRLGTAAAQLKAAGATPEMIRRLPEAWCGVFPGRSMPTWTPNAAVEHWPALAAWISRGYVARGTDEGDAAKLRRELERGRASA